MKITAATALAILAFTSSAAAQHRHHHARQAKEERRDAVVQKRAEAVDTVIEIQYVYVDQDGNVFEPASTSMDYETSSIVIPPTTTSTSLTPTESSVETSSTPSSSSSEESTSTSSSSAPAASSGSSSSGATGVDVEYVDGSLSCSEFPSAYGAVALDYLGNNGWSGIQLAGNDAGDSTSCTEGAYCSYACPPGYSKSQWPSDQPSDGESRGGLLCSNGKLCLTRPAVTTLCVAGQGSAQVVNKMSQQVTVCRTDYPGTENMVIPTVPQAGSSEPLTVVVEEDYYIWEGGLTSAQYYVNKAGLDVSKSCIWGTEAGGVGNWAPLVFGAGFKDGTTWISLFPNPLAGGADAGYDVEIVAAPGGVINGECSYKNNVFSTSGGCTVAVTSGSAYYVFTER